MRERDNEKLSERIADARRAILDRADEVLLHPSSDEWRPLNHALRTLHLLEGGLSGEGNAAPRPTRTEEVEAALDVLFTQPVTVHQCQRCGCEMVNLDATIYLAETERRWNVPLPVCPRCDLEEYLKLISLRAA
jgi:hypothetical protein